MGDTENEKKQRLGAFVQHNWITLAAAAWRNYMKNGRGFTLIDWRAVESWEAGRAFSFAPPYVSWTEFEDAQAYLEAYDPEEAILIGITTDPEAPAAEFTSSPQVSFEPESPQFFMLHEGEYLYIWPFAYSPAPPVAHTKSSHS